MKLDFTIHGIAQPAGSKRAFPFKRRDGSQGVTVTDANPKSREWKDLVAAEVRSRYDGPLLEGALSLTLAFVVMRPKGHFGKKGLLASARMYPTVKPDNTKLLRGVEDALTGIIWRDDAQIVDQHVTKRYGDRPCVRITVETVTEAVEKRPEETVEALLA